MYMKKAIAPTATNPRFEEGATEGVDPKTGRDTSNIPTTGIESMPVTIRVAQDVTHIGDMGRLGKSE
jgi:hypothetical protein